MHDTKFLPSYPVRTFVKQILVLFATVLILIPEVYAEDDKWIDGIRIRYGVSGVLPRIKFVSPGKKEGKTILKSHDNIASHNVSAGSGILESWTRTGVPAPILNINQLYRRLFIESKPASKLAEKKINWRCNYSDIDTIIDSMWQMYK